jgi:NCS2 family nucleobase:cation symporter-2
MILGGLQVMMSRMLDTRRIFVIGIAVIFGLSVEMVPGLYSSVPAWIKPLFSSSLSLGTVLVVGLNLLFQLGTSKRKVFDIDPVASLGDSDVRRMMEELGATWGMRPEVAMRAANCLHELMIYFGHLGVHGPVHITAQFDEFNLDFNVEYAGPAIDFPLQPPRVEEIATEEAGAMPLLCAYVVRGYADGVKVSSDAGKSRIHLHFDD